MRQIDLRRGLLRTWLAGSACWIAVIFALERPDESGRLYYRTTKFVTLASELLESSTSDQVYWPLTEKMLDRAELEANLTKITASQTHLKSAMLLFLMKAFMPSLIALALGHLVVWVLLGFKRDIT